MNTAVSGMPVSDQHFHRVGFADMGEELNRVTHGNQGMGRWRWERDPPTTTNEANGEMDVMAWLEGI